MKAARRWGIVGGGMLGLTLALRLSQRGEHVTVFEAAPHLGGLASAWTLDDVVWDRHYHVTLLSDSSLRGLLSELGLERDMEWTETKTGCFTDGRLYPVSSPVEFLRFPPLRLIDKLRLGGTIFYGSKVRNWRRLEDVPVEQWLTRWSGRRAVDRFWLPLLRAKLGDSYREASAAFLWATIRRLDAARSAGLKREMFGYVPGGYARILERFAEVLTERGVDLRLGAAVASIASDGDVVELVERDGATHGFDRVVVTVNTSLAKRMVPQLREDERAVLDSVHYQGVVCASMLLERSLSPYYLTYITDDVPFTAVVEMSTLVDRRHFGGRSLVYLPKYCRPDDVVAKMTDDEVRETFVGGLERMYPSFRRDDVVAFRVSRVKEVFAIPTLGYSRGVPPIATSVPRVDLVTSAQIVNGTLNVNETVQLAERALVPLLRDDARATAPGRGRAAAGPSSGSRGTRPVATLSLDLDDLWSYLKTHGDDGWRSYPSFLDRVIPRALRFFDERGISITWFVVGRDAASADHRPLLASIVAEGHEVGNHSFMHEPWLDRYGPERLDDEVGRAEEAIVTATGQRPEGFRGPGFSVSLDVLEVLGRRGYRYDASTLPTFVGPLARAWYLRSTDLPAEERAKRDALFGSFRDGFRPLTPYRWALTGAHVVEVPVTTMPIVRTPIHVSYVMVLAQRSTALAVAYVAAALRLCRAMGVAPSLLVHSHDFVGMDDVPAMSFFPGFRMRGEDKLRVLARCVDLVRRHYDVIPLGRYVEGLGNLRVVEPPLARRADPSITASTPSAGATWSDR